MNFLSRLKESIAVKCNTCIAKQFCCKHFQQKLVEYTCYFATLLKSQILMFFILFCHEMVSPSRYRDSAGPLHTDEDPTTIESPLRRLSREPFDLYIKKILQRNVTNPKLK